jgi:hypothetical protein
MEKIIILIARLGLGLAFLIFGIDGLILVMGMKGFLPMPPRNPEMAAVMKAFYDLEYMMPLVKIIETSTAIMLLTNCYVRLAIVLLGPIIINILLINIFVGASSPVILVLAFLFVIALVLIVYEHWNFFGKLFERKNISEN